MGSFNSYIDSSDVEFWKNLCIKSGKLRRYKAGDIFVEEGQKNQYLGYIEKGCFKYVVRDSRGYEHIINFEFSGGFIGTVLDVIYDLPTKFSIKAISSADIYSITGDDLRTWASDDKDFRIKLAQLSDMIFMEFRNRTILLYTMTPKEQYEMLMAENPELFETLRLSDIASFLRITPEHLSRIRKSLRAE